MSAPLTNRAIDRAEAAGEQWQRYRATRRQSVEAYLAAGHALLEGLAEIRHGQKGAYYKRTGIPVDTAERMLTLTRAGMSLDDVLAAGGIRAATERLRRAKMGREIPHGAESDVPEPAETRAHVHESALAGSETRSVQAGAPAPRTSADRNSAPAGPMTPYQLRRAMSLCTACGGPSPDGAVRCPGCVERVSAQRAKRRVLAAVGGVLAPRIEAAAKAGEGIQLDAAEVAALARPPRRKRKAKP